MRAVLAAVLLAVAAEAGPPAVPPLKPSQSLAPFLDQVPPGGDAFPEERDAEVVAAHLAELGERLKRDPRAAGAVAEWLLAPGFRGGRLLPPSAAPQPPPALEVARSPALPQDLSLDARGFAGELGRLLAELREVAVAEFQVTAIEVDGERGPARTEVRYDLVGPGASAWRVQHTGSWRLAWERAAAGWRVVEWTATAHVASRARAPVFTEVTASAFAGSDSFRRQLGVALDAWSATLDSVLARDSNGHHGLSVGDADGDGREDLYVAQPSGLPNRLYRARGDGSFEDATEAAGLDVLDDTAQSLFADVDNDGDQDLVLATPTRPLLFANDGRGRFAPVADAFRFDRPLQGSLTSMAMADYDRDGFLDLYLCVYAYFFGAGEDKAGTPMPYHDARNGPPGVLFRNDGRGRFVDATAEAGLEAGNDRYHFAAAWADYDHDGWIDLLVANDFGVKNLYRNLGRRGGRVRFEDVASAAGVLDHGAGMSAAFLDYDNDGRLDIYTGNMWSAPGLRVTAHPAFLPQAPPEARALYRRHARGNSLFRNRGDGTFEDVSLAARAEMGRWAWASDALDFDSDGWDDLYVVNGMITRAGPDLEGFFWRQVVARSPQARVTGTPYDDAWRAVNQLLVHGSIAARQRNVFLRNDGRGGYDDVSGTLGLDLDQDGRSFAVLDVDRDGDPDLALMASRQAPQLRVFRNDFEGRGAALAIRLRGTTSNRDGVGARVTVEAGPLRRTRTVQAGSGFLSQHSRELLIGLGSSRHAARLTVEWPSGLTQTFEGVPADHHLALDEGGELQREPFAAAARPGGAAPALPAAPPPPRASWLYEPFPAPEISGADRAGQRLSLQALRGRPALLLLGEAGGGASRAAFEALARGSRDLERAGVGTLGAVVGPAAPGVTGVPVIAAAPEAALSYAVLHRHVFMNRQDLRLPTAFLLDRGGDVVKVYREHLDVAQVAADAARIEAAPPERLARALPFPGRLHLPAGRRDYLPYGRELLDQGLEAAAVAAFERAAQASPSASTLYRLGTLLVKSREPRRARSAFEGALALKPDLAEASNDLGALLAQDGELPAAIERFRAALAASPDYPDALNNLGYALLVTGREQEARALYEKALALQPDFPEALNNLGMLFGRAGDMEAAEARFRSALRHRPGYGEAANNLALVLVARGREGEAERLLREFVEAHPEAESAYLALAKVHLAAGRRREGLAVLERLLQRYPGHVGARELLRELGPGPP